MSNRRFALPHCSTSSNPKFNLILLTTIDDSLDNKIRDDGELNPLEGTRHGYQYENEEHRPAAPVDLRLNGRRVPIFMGLTFFWCAERVIRVIACLIRGHHPVAGAFHLLPCSHCGPAAGPSGSTSADQRSRRACRVNQQLRPRILKKHEAYSLPRRRFSTKSLCAASRVASFKGRENPFRGQV